MWFYVATLLFVTHSVETLVRKWHVAQNRPVTMHELSEGGMDGVAVHASKLRVRRARGSPQSAFLVWNVPITRSRC